MTENDNDLTTPLLIMETTSEQDTRKKPHLAKLATAQKKLQETKGVLRQHITKEQQKMPSDVELDTLASYRTQFIRPPKKEKKTSCCCSCWSNLFKKKSSSTTEMAYRPLSSGPTKKS